MSRRRSLLVAALVAASLLTVPAAAHAATIPTPPAACTLVQHPGHPVITSFSLTPGSVDVRQAAHRIRFSVHARDNTQRVTDVLVSLVSPGPAAYQRNVDVTLHRSAGTGKDGTWTGSTLVPRWTNPGTWKVTEVDLFDAGGAFVGYVPAGGGDQPWTSSWPSTFHVASTPDHKAPAVTSLHLSSASVNTSNTRKTVQVRAVATDAASGVAGGLQLQAYAVFGGQGHSAAAVLKRTQGTAHHGTYVGRLTIPTWVGSGTHTWHLTLDAEDHVGNHLSLPSWAMRQRHLPSTLSVTSRGDTQNPVLTGLALSPTAVDARTHDRVVYATIKGTDVGSGLETAWVVLSSPSGYGVSSSNEEMPPSPVVNGAVHARVVIPRCSEPGVWTVSVGLVDASGNYREYSPSQVKTLGLPSKITVKALDITPPSARVPSKVPHAGPVVVTFSEPTLWKGSTVPLKVTDETTSARVAGTWTCTNASHVVVGCNDDGADVVRARFAPASALTVGRHYLVESSHGIYDTYGNGPGFVYSEFRAT
jgi:hypothetical protein